jgi:PAS domain S-box-containing protein
MKKLTPTKKQLIIENENIRWRLDEAEDTLRAIRSGEVDALIVSGVDGEQVFSLKGVDHSYRMLIEDMNEGALTLTPEGMIMYANRRFAEMLKTPLEKVIGSTIHTWVAPPDKKISKALLRQENIQAPSRGEVILRASDGTLVPVNFSINFFPKEEMHGLICMVTTDLTEPKRLANELIATADKSRLALLSVIEDQKKTEEELKKSEVRFRGLYENATIGMYRTTPEGNILLANPALVSMLGFESFEELSQRDLASEGYAPNYPRLEFQKRLEQDGEVRGLESAWKRKDGSFIFVRESTHLARNEKDQPIYYEGTVEDITERKGAEEALRESEEKYRGLVTEISDGIFITNDRGEVTFANLALARIHGFDHPDKIVGKTFQEFIAAPMLNEASRYFKQVIEGELPEGALTTELVHPDGTVAVVEVIASLVQQGGKFAGTHGVVRDITERTKREKEILSRNEELKTLYQLSRALADAEDIENVIQLVNRHAAESVHTSFACIALMEGGELVPRAVYPVRKMEHDLTLGNRQPITALPVCQRVLDKNEPVVLNSGTLEASSAERTTLMLDFAQSICLVPLQVGDPAQHKNQALGLLILGEAREEKREPFTPEKIRLARSIGDQAAAAIRRLLLREQAEHRLQQLAALSEIDRTIASNFDLRISLQIVIKHVLEHLRVDAADILVFNNHSKLLEYAAGSGYHSTALEGTQQRLGEGQAGRAMLERQIIQITDVPASGATFARPDLLKAENVAAYFAVPLIIKGQVMGVLEICHRSPLDPNEEWLDFLRTLAGQAAIAIDTVHMFENLQRSTDELELAYDATIEGWSHALDLRDKETEGHTKRVTEMTVKLARTFGLNEAELMKVRWGALLHDIGKMGVPDAILLKPGALTK